MSAPDVPLHRLTLGQRVIYRALEDLLREKASLVPGARLAVRRNMKGELVFAIVAPDFPFSET